MKPGERKLPVAKLCGDSSNGETETFERNDRSFL